MGSVLAGEFTGTMEKLVLTLLQANEETYDEGYHTKEKMIEDMEKLYDAGQGKLGTDVSTTEQPERPMATIFVYHLLFLC